MSSRYLPGIWEPQDRRVRRFIFESEFMKIKSHLMWYEGMCTLYSVLRNFSVRFSYSELCGERTRQVANRKCLCWTLHWDTRKCPVVQLTIITDYNHWSSLELESPGEGETKVAEIRKLYRILTYMRTRSNEVLVSLYATAKYTTKVVGKIGKERGTFCCYSAQIRDPWRGNGQSFWGRRVKKREQVEEGACWEISSWGIWKFKRFQRTIYDGMAHYLTGENETKKKRTKISAVS